MRFALRGFAGLWVGLAVFLASSAVATASPDVHVNDILKFSQGTGGANGGGEFIATDTTTHTSFVTFCVQTSEHIDFSSNFKVGSLNTYSIAGNAPLQQQTAYLYTKFRDGTLSVGGHLPSSYTNSNGSALQAAIWYFQLGRSFSGDSTATQTQALVNLANNAVSTHQWEGTGSVKIINLYYASNGANAQDQLCLAVPEPASLAGWTLMGICFVGPVLRRKFRSTTLAA